LYEQGHVVLAAEGAKEVGCAVERGVAGEEDEGAALGIQEILSDALGCGGDEVGGVGLRQGGLDVHGDLLGVVEGRIELKLRGLFEAESTAEIGEAVGAAGGHGGAGEDDAPCGLEELLIEDLIDAERGGVEAGSGIAALGDFEPVDGAFDLLPEETVHGLGGFGAAIGEAVELELVIGAIESVVERLEACGQFFEGGSEQVWNRIGFGNADRAAGCGEGLSQNPEQGVATGLGIEELLDDVWTIEHGDESAAGAFVEDGVEEASDLCVGDAHSHVVTGGGFDVVGFVEDDGVVVGQDGGVALPECEVGEEEGMVDDEEVGILGAATGALVETLVVEVALVAHAVVSLAADALPEVGEWFKGQIGEGAVGGSIGPIFNLVELSHIASVAEEGVLPSAGLHEAAQADVVGSAFDEDGPEGAGDQWGEGGDVFFDELFLECDGVGGDDDAPARGEDAVDGGEEVGETFTDAGAGLDDEMAFVCEGIGDGLGHGDLLGPWLVVGDGAGD